MKKLTSKLVAFALVAVLAFALTGCFVTPTTTISFNKLPEATYEVGSSEQTALSSIVVTLSDTDYEESGNLWDLKEAGKIVVEGFDLSSEGPKTAKIIFGTAVLTFKYTVAAAALEIDSQEDLAAAFAKNGTVLAKVVANFELEELLTVKAGAKVVLDLNGKTISSNFESETRLITIESGAKLEIKDSASNGAIINYEGLVAGIFQVAGEFVIHGGTFTDYGWNRPSQATTSPYSNGGMISLDAGSQFTLYGGTINSVKHADVPTSTYGEVYGRALIWVNDGSSAKIYGGTINHATPGNTYAANYAIRSIGDLFIYDCTIVSDRGAFSCTDGTFDIRGGNFTSKTAWALYISGDHDDVSGVISGGTFTANVGTVICFGNEGDGGNYRHVNVVVTGGTFLSGNSTYNVTVSGKLATANFQGGTYGAKFNSPAIAEGYNWVENADGTWSLVK